MNEKKYRHFTLCLHKFMKIEEFVLHLKNNYGVEVTGKVQDYGGNNRVNIKVPEQEVGYFREYLAGFGTGVVSHWAAPEKKNYMVEFKSDKTRDELVDLFVKSGIEPELIEEV